MAWHEREAGITALHHGEEVKREPRLFTSGFVTIEAFMDNRSYSWPISAADLRDACSNQLSLDTLSSDLLDYLDTSNLSWDRCDITAVPSWEGVSFSATASIDIPIASGARKEKAAEKSKDDVDEEIDSLPDSIASALDGDGDSVGFNHPDLEDVTPSVSAEWVGGKLRLTVDVPSTLRAWSDPLPSLEEALPSECDFSEVPIHIRSLLGVTGDSVPWESLDIADHTDESGPCYSATATLYLELGGALDEDDKNTLDDALQVNFYRLHADLGSAEGAYDDGGYVSVNVEQEFDEPEPDEDEDDADVAREEKEQA